MKNKLTVAALLAFVLCFSVKAQTSPRDSSTSEIQKQALEMREKLNKYMAERLLLEEQKNDPALRSFVDSVSNQLYQQQEEIEKLKEQFKRLEEALINGGTYTPGDGSAIPVKQAGAGRNGKPAAQDQENGQVYPTFQRYGDKQLNLYFAFDEYKLSKEQITELRAFLKGKKIRRVTVNGYTDWKGTEKHNATLGDKRCKSVVRILNQLIIHYATNSNHNCDNNNDYSPEKARWCRRVEVIIR